MPAAYLLTAFAVTALAGWALRPVAAQVGLLDHPGGRKTHAVPTPLVGGLGIFIGVVFTTIWLPEALLAYGPFLSLSALVLFIGTIDDLKQLRATTRMTGQSLVALVMAVVAGVQLHSLGNAFGSELLLGWLGIPFTVFATVGVINAINMSDGIDGLSGGLSAIALAFIAALALAGGQGLHASFVALIVFALLAFLLLNFRRPWGRSALIYLGDGGSTMLGFMLAWLLIDASQGEGALFAPVHALWFLAVPLLDTVNLLI
ncbi:MAG: MraY family glycosyltransferase, partial [Pseudohongiellaceae bacterium]